MYLIMFPASLRALSVLFVRGISAVTCLKCSRSLHILSAVEFEISIIFLSLSIVTHCGLSAWGAIAVADKHYIFPPRQRRASYERLTTSTLGSTASSYRSQRHSGKFQERTSATASNRSGLHRQKYNIIFYYANFLRDSFTYFSCATLNSININHLTLFCCKFTHNVTLFYLCCRLPFGNPTMPEVVRGQTKSLTK